MGYYETLKVSKDADRKEIRNNYTNLASQVHPRKQQEQMAKSQQQQQQQQQPQQQQQQQTLQKTQQTQQSQLSQQSTSLSRTFEDAINAFTSLTEAFNVLYDPFMRNIYDTRGIQGLNDDLLSNKLMHPFFAEDPWLHSFRFSDWGRPLYPLQEALNLYNNVYTPSDICSDTFCQAQQLCDCVSQGKTELSLDKNNQLLQGSKDFQNMMSGINKDMQVTGKTYSSSRINKGGNTVEVTKECFLSPEGKVETKVTQSFIDSKGKKDSKTFSNQEMLNIGSLTKGDDKMSIESEQKTLDKGAMQQEQSYGQKTQQTQQSKHQQSKQQQSMPASFQ